MALLGRHPKHSCEYVFFLLCFCLFLLVFVLGTNLQVLCGECGKKVVHKMAKSRGENRRRKWKVSVSFPRLCPRVDLPVEII